MCGVNLGVCANRSEKNVRMFQKTRCHVGCQLCFKRASAGGALGRGAGMFKSILRPNVRRALPDEDVEVGVTEHASSKGTKRKRASKTKGPCEHGVKYRSNCKVCSACPHGKRRRYCKECGGAESASTVVYALYARSAVGLESASTVVSALRARSAVGLKSASTVVYALSARSAVGLQSASTVVYALVQGVRRVCNLRARSSAPIVQGVRWWRNLRARS